jgi:DNA processing protein
MLFRPPSLPPEETLFRLSLVEGVTRRHLPLLAGREWDGEPLPPGDGGSLLARAAEILSPRGDRAAGEARRRCDALGVRVVTYLAPAYPPLLRTLPDAPTALFLLGAPPPEGDAVAVVGSRAATRDGVLFAYELSRGLAEEGVAVVSGMARGVDGAAHSGALDGGGSTVAVLGCGVDVTYPPEAASLRERILANGSLLSEYPPGTAPARHRFPARNRIVSALSRCVVVAEAPRRSGALVTARLALEQGRDVMAAPGSPRYDQTAGSNRLIRDGAAPVTCVDDVLAALGREKGRIGVGG